MPLSSARALGVFLAVTVAASACSSAPEVVPTETATPTEASTPTPTPTTGGTLRFGLADDPAAIDPGFVIDEEGAIVADALFDSLVAIDDDLSTIRPAAAEAWAVDDAGTTYLFDLRDGATFHDGTPVTAGDFVRAFARIADGTRDDPSFIAYKLAPLVGFAQAQAEGGPLAGVEAVDEDTLELRLQYPVAEFLLVLADPALGPIPAAADDDPESFADNPIGNGPFQMAEPWQHNQFIRLARVPGHPEVPLLDEVLFQIYPGEDAATLQYDDFAQGRLDVADVPIAQLAVAAERFGESSDGHAGPGLLQGATATLYYYGFNTRTAPFDDPAVRRALSQLIDRDAINEEILRDARVPATAIVPPDLPGAQPGACSHCTFDPAAAASVLLREDGTSVLPDPLRLLVNEGDTHEAIATRVARDVEAALGITVEVQTGSLSEIVTAVRAGDAHVFRLGWLADHPGQGSYLQPLFRSDSAGLDNLTWFADPAVDELLEEAQSEVDTAARRALYQEVERLVLDAAPVAPISFYRVNRIVGSGVEGLVVDPLGRVDLTRVRLDRA